jgi:CTP-dependent riboflavin kinase
MSAPGILDQLEQLFGYPIVPGTLNVRLPEPFNRPLTVRYLAASEIDPVFEEETGQAGFFLAPVLIADSYRGMAMQAVEVDYPDDQVELLCEVHLRQTLGLVDGDEITFSVLDA